jgi:flagellar protein FliO/FliZ
MEFSGYLKFVFALAFVIGLIGLLSFLVRRFGMGAMAPYRKGAGRRLAVIEVAAVDTKRRLVLLRRDDTEHLVLLGANSELLIESGIQAQRPKGSDGC